MGNILLFIKKKKCHIFHSLLFEIRKLSVFSFVFYVSVIKK